MVGWDGNSELQANTHNFQACDKTSQCTLTDICQVTPKNCHHTINWVQMFSGLGWMVGARSGAAPVGHSKELILVLLCSRLLANFIHLVRLYLKLLFQCGYHLLTSCKEEGECERGCLRGSGKWRNAERSMEKLRTPLMNAAWSGMGMECLPWLTCTTST